MAEQIQQRMEAAMAKYLTIKAALLEPETLRLMMEMTSATCDLLVQVVKTVTLYSSAPKSGDESYFGGHWARFHPEFLEWGLYFLT